MPDATLTDGALAKLAGKYLTFTLREETFAIPVLQTREIIRLVEITAVPRMPEHVRGIINLRGRIIPVVDLRLRLFLSEPTTTEQTCIIVVVVVQPNGQTTQMGLIVDAVQEVVNLCLADISPPPEFGGAITTDFMLGLATLKGDIKTLLDINRVLTGVAVDSPQSLPVLPEFPVPGSP